MADIKFCGLTRPEDAAEASRCGATYAGVIFAGGPRQVSPSRAREVLDDARGALRVGVFGASSPESIAEVAREASLDIVQLHADPKHDAIDAVRAHFGGEVWAVLRLQSTELPADVDDLVGAADAIVLDALVPGRLGGTGQPLDWKRLGPRLDAIRGRVTLVLAGGLEPDNVAGALSLVGPDVVDVSSGVESAPGIKDHARMRAFAKAVHDSAMRAGHDDCGP